MLAELPKIVLDVAITGGIQNGNDLKNLFEGRFFTVKEFNAFNGIRRA